MYAEVLGRRGSFDALVDPLCSTVVIGQLLPTTLHLVIDETTRRLRRRHPKKIIVDVEYPYE